VDASTPKIAPPESFRLSDADYQSFKEFVKAKDFKYDQLSERSLEQLKNMMEFEGYMDVASSEYKALRQSCIPIWIAILNYSEKISAA